MEAAALAGEFLPGLGREAETPGTPLEAPVKRGRGRPRKDAPAPGEPSPQQKPAAPPAKATPIKDAIDKGLPWFREGEVLSEAEAKAIYEPLKAALGDYFDYIDEYVWYREQHSRGDEPIWGDADDDELSAISRLMIRRAKRSAGAATVVRAIVNGDDYVTATVFGIERIVKTQQRLRAAPKRERKRR